MEKNQFLSVNNQNTKISEILFSKYIKNTIRIFVSLFILLEFTSIELQAQCTSGIVLGQNLVTNGDFSQDYTGWTFDPAYSIFTPCGNCYSVPGKIYAGIKPSVFNPGGFTTDFPDHSPSADNKFLMVDGLCTSGVILWSQTINVIASTTYYFETYITTLSAPTPHGSLQFYVNGLPIGSSFSPTNTIGQWTLASFTWLSAGAGPATISIVNTETTGCQTAVDFAIDDISFTPGCAFSAVGPVPNLGPDQSICGKGGSITLNSNVPHNGTTTVTWTNSGVGSTVAPIPTGTGLLAPYTTVINAAGTYTVCVSDGGSCVRSDVIVVTASYTINLGPPITLCNPVTANLDALYTGPGVTYQWYQAAMIPADTLPGGKTSTYTATFPATYFVKVTDPICGVQTSSVVISTQAATPTNGVFCGTAKGGSGTTTLSVSGPGGTKYKWWSTPGPVGGTKLAVGTSYSPTGLTGPGPYTYYVEDTSSFKGTVAAPATFATSTFTNVANVGPTDGNNGGHKSALYFNASLGFTLDTLSVLPYVYYCPPVGTPGSQYSIIISIKDNAGVNLPGSPVTYPVPNTLCVNAAPNTVPVKVPIGIAIPAGSGYQIQLAGTSNTIALYLNSGGTGVEPSPRLYTYPTTYSVSGNPVASIIGNDANSFNLYYSPDAYPGFFDWKITRGSACQRVPVIATELCGLPVSYVSFEATPVSGFVKLKWQASNEVNTNYYTIERSEDGINFISIGSLNAEGNNSGGVISYSFIDRSPVLGTSYYRIKEVDQNGSAYYTVVRSVTSEENSVVVKPNPNQGSFTTTFKSAVSEKIILNIVNALGQTVYHFSDVSNTEVFAKDIDISELASGVYVLQINSGSNTWVKKIIKE
jgi:hypothetical protein